jgi:putative SOS response-associated peptidase YedK
MCNRYEQQGSVSKIRALASKLGRNLITTPATDNLPPQANIYPDQDAPILVNAPDGSLELIMARWGFAFLTTEANDIVRPAHEKAMPVILTDSAEQSGWLEGGENSLRLQRPLPSEMLEIRAGE